MKTFKDVYNITILCRDKTDSSLMIMLPNPMEQAEIFEYVRHNYKGWEVELMACSELSEEMFYKKLHDEDEKYFENGFRKGISTLDVKPLEKIMKTQIANPLNYTCALNYATPDYVTASNFRDFVAYGMMRCWLSTDANDPNADCHCSRPITHSDVQELRKYFLDCLESVIYYIWKGDFVPGYGWVDGDFQSLIIANGEEDRNETCFQWVPRLDNDAIMLELSNDTVIWFAYETLEDRQNVIKVLQEARSTVNGEVWDKLIAEGRDWREDVRDLFALYQESGSSLSYREWLEILNAVPC